MTVHFEILTHIEEQLRAAGIDPTQTAKELFFVERLGKLEIALLSEQNRPGSP